MKSLIRTAGIAAAAAGLLALSASAAEANPFGDAYNDTYYWADNSNHTYYLDALEGPHVIAMDYVMGTRLDAGTDMTATKQTSSNGDTDVIASDGIWLESWFGTWQCTDVRKHWWGGDTGVCEAGEIQINFYTGYQNSKTACHEVGHSVGLLHHSLTDTCMHAFYDPSMPSDWNSHDKWHINDYY